MATYVAGDPHGCFGAFRRLLAEIGFGAGDRMVVVGDLVNRGPESAEMVRWVKEREGTAEAVLGNHDIFMLLVHEGFASLHDADTTGDLLEGADAGELCGWLRRRPLALRIGDYLVVHAGIPPDWDVTDAEREARAVEEAFRGPDYRSLFGRLLGNEPALVDEESGPADRLRYAVNALTRMRMCRSDSGALDFSHKGGPEGAAPGLKPWYDFRGDFGGTTVVCGHWASLGARDMGHVVSLDSGCAWGGRLTCLRLEDRKMFSVPGAEGATPPWAGQAASSPPK